MPGRCEVRAPVQELASVRIICHVEPQRNISHLAMREILRLRPQDDHRYLSMFSCSYVSY